jgi:hypothetical protein
MRLFRNLAIWAFLTSVVACSGTNPVEPSHGRAVTSPQSGLALSGVVTPMEKCTYETCPGGGTGPGHSYGYALGFTFNACIQNTVTGIDVDTDGLDDECEWQIASTFAPMLRLTSGDNTTGRETYWASHHKNSCGAYTPTIGGGGEPQGSCLWYTNVIRVIYALGYYADGGCCGLSGHVGDSEFIVLEAAYNQTDNVWYTTRAYLSAHVNQNWPGPGADGSRWWYGDEMEYPWNRGYPRIYVSKEKHANYPTDSACDSGGWIGGDSCGGSFFDQRVGVQRTRNIGELNRQLVNCVSSVSSTRQGIECFWTDIYFDGWYTFSNATEGYRDYLLAFMSSPGGWDNSVL